MRATAGADPLALAVRNRGGDAAVWAWLSGADPDGRAYERCGEEEGANMLDIMSKTPCLPRA